MSTASKSFLGVLSLFPIALLSAAACGGSALDNHSGTARGNGVAGSSSAGGSASSAGSGGSFAGAPQGVAGTGHAGYAAGGAISGGGNGNAGSGGFDVSACTSNTQCKVVPVSCCGACNSGSLASYTAINSANEMQFFARCATVDCAPCGSTLAPTLNDPSLYFVATCRKPADAAPDAPGKCVVVDLRATELTACKTQSDCGLRSGTGCCSGCSGRLVALNGSHAPELSDLVCGSEEPTACPACAPIFDGYRATCVEGRCSVETTSCTAEHPCF